MKEEEKAIEYFNCETTSEVMHYGAVLVKLIETQKAELERLKEYKKISELTKISCCTAQNCEALNNAIREGLENNKLQAEIEKKEKRISDLEFALMDMVLQFADEDKKQINTMGLSALEIAFTELDLYDPIDKKEVEKKYAELAAKYYGLVEGEKKDE